MDMLGPAILSFIERLSSLRRLKFTGIYNREGSFNIVIERLSSLCVHDSQVPFKKKNQQHTYHLLKLLKVFLITFVISWIAMIESIAVKKLHVVNG